MNPMAGPLSEQDMADIAAYFASQTLKVASVDAAAAAPGARLYQAGNSATGVPACMACHAPNGAGNPTAKYPSLRGQHARYTTTQLLAYKNNERNAGQASVMTAIAARLTKQEIEQVATYLEGLH
jgi:cytochrome c553